jgi:hypothetical protein
MPPNTNKPQNDYDFILRDVPIPKNKVSLGGSMILRIAVIVVGVIILIIMALVISSFLNKASNAQKERLLETAQAQTEMIRITKIGETKAGELGVRSLATTTQLALISQQQDTKAALIKRGAKAKGIEKTFGAKKNVKTDAALNDAGSNNRFDDTFLEILNTQLNDYKKLLQNADGGANPTEKKALSAAFASIQSIQKSDKFPKSNAGNTSN